METVARIEKPFLQALRDENEEKLLRLADDLSAYDHLLITKEKEIARDEPTITIDGAYFAAPGNISAISAPPKTIKTSLMYGFAAAALSPSGEVEGFNSVRAKINTDQFAVIICDTEQSESDQQHQLNVCLGRVGLTSTPDILRCYNFRQLFLSDYRKTLENICKYSSDKYKGIYAIFIDGGADFLTSVNDEKETTDFIQYLTHLAIKYSCPVIVVIHQNPGTTKERGHFGSSLQRKCYGLIEVIKDGDFFTVQPKMLRRAGNSDINPIHVKYDKVRGYHVQTEIDSNSDSRAFKERMRLKQVSDAVFSPTTSLRHKEAVEKIMDFTSKKLSTAKSMLENMEAFGYIIKGIDGNYRQGQNGSK